MKWLIFSKKKECLQTWNIHFIYGRRFLELHAVPQTFGCSPFHQPIQFAPRLGTCWLRSKCSYDSFSYLSDHLIFMDHPDLTELKALWKLKDSHISTLFVFGFLGLFFRTNKLWQIHIGIDQITLDLFSYCSIIWMDSFTLIGNKLCASAKLVGFDCGKFRD